MRYIVFSIALILSLEFFGASIATAMDGCGHHHHRNRAGHCVMH
jgi:hypothetical protein